MKIGVFDSGLGGLTVLRELKKTYPHLEMLYVADTKHVPYGTKLEETVAKYSMEIGKFLVKEGAEAIVIACNTATAYGLNCLQQEFPHIPIVGMIEGGSFLATKEGQKKIGLLATKGTIASGAYMKEISRLAPKAKIECVAGSILVPLIEEGFRDHEGTCLILKTYLEGFKDIDTLIMGCTHFPFLEEKIKKLCPNWELINPAIGVMEKLQGKLKNLGNGEVLYFVTGDEGDFSEKASMLMGVEIDAKKLQLM